MEVVHWRLLFDFGLVVLIWLVQLVIYPGFQYYKAEDLLRWHQKYTRRIGVIVMPLMMGQIIMTSIYIAIKSSVWAWCGMLFILIVWLITFIYFVPAHRKISEDATEAVLTKLAQKNWWRTWLWSAVFAISLFEILLD